MKFFKYIPEDIPYLKYFYYKHLSKKEMFFKLSLINSQNLIKKTSF